jgi:hypothetical protein
MHHQSSRLDWAPADDDSAENPSSATSAAGSVSMVASVKMDRRHQQRPVDDVVAQDVLPSGGETAALSAADGNGVRRPAETMGPEDVMVPTNCTGWEARAALAGAFCDAFVPNTVGTRLEL